MTTYQLEAAPAVAVETPQHSMLDLLSPSGLRHVVTDALTGGAVLSLPAGRAYTMTIRPWSAATPAESVHDSLGSWIAGHVGACLAATAVDAMAYEVTVTRHGEPA